MFDYDEKNIFASKYNINCNVKNNMLLPFIWYKNIRGVTI